jgi:hypothetical protein
MARALSLFEAATTRGRVIRQGEIVQWVMDGSGAIVVPAQDFLIAQKWGQSRTGSTNIVTDRGRFLEKFETLIARPGSFVSTRGNTRSLASLAKLMIASGYDISEWGLPFDVKQALKPADPNQAKSKTANPADDEAAAAQASTLPHR